MISWQKPFETAFFHRSELAETAYKKLRLLWNSPVSAREKFKVFQGVFLSSLVCGLDSLALTTPQLKRVDGFYHKFLCRIYGIKASYYSRVSNQGVYHIANQPKLPSQSILLSQKNMLVEVFAINNDDPLRLVVFQGVYKDRIYTQGRRRGMQFPYSIETLTKRLYPHMWADHAAHIARPNLGNSFKYSMLARELRQKGALAPKRVHESCARPP